MNQIHKTVVLLLLRAYKWAISPMFLPACRYMPSCSEYAMEAIDRYGVAQGSLMAIWRVMRCHPFAKGGIDPVIKLEASKSTGCGVPVRSAWRNQALQSLRK
jgi:putative membrane protein insertion efficiency factor